MGRDAAILFSEEGASVCVADVDGAAAEETAARASDAFAVTVDVADAASVEAMYAATAERYGGIDVLYNNAGISPADDASILETEPEAWQRVQDVNTKGVYLCCKYGIAYLLERGGGSVINVASFVALMGAATSQISHTASKGAVHSLSRELGVQFARQGIRVNALCPGPVETRSSCGSSAMIPPRTSGVASTCRRRALPGERRIVIRERRDVPRRRRPDGGLRHSGIDKTILPNCSPDSMRSCAARASASGKTESTTGFAFPEATSS